MREAASSMARHPKLDVAETAAYIEDLRINMANQRDSIRRYEEKKVFGNDIPPRTQTAGDDMGNFIVCDDYHVDNSTRPAAAPVASNKLPIAAAIVAAAIAGYSLLPDRGVPAPEPDNIPPVATPATPDADTRYNLEFLEFLE